MAQHVTRETNGTHSYIPRWHSYVGYRNHVHTANPLGLFLGIETISRTGEIFFPQMYIDWGNPDCHIGVYF